MTVYIQFEDQSKKRVAAVFSGAQDPDQLENYAEIEDDDPRYLEYLNPTPSDDELRASAMQEIADKTRTEYDPHISTALRHLRMAKTPDELRAASDTVAALDAYAEALYLVPSQTSFPGKIKWPKPPAV